MGLAHTPSPPWLYARDANRAGCSDIVSLQDPSRSPVGKPFAAASAGVLHRSVKKPKLTPFDRLLWACLCRAWADWRSTLIVGKPETVIAWHRKGFRLFWTWKVRHGHPGRPSVPKDVRDLIRLMSRANPTWGAPRIHGELLKLGMKIGETSVSKYMDGHRRPPSQTWRTFLENHVKNLVSVDFFTVPTLRFDPNQWPRRSCG